MVGFPFQLVRKTRRAGGFSPSSERTDESALLRAGPPLCRADLLTTQSEGCDALLATASSVGADAVHCSVPNRLSYICLYIYIYIYTYLCVYLCLSLSLSIYIYIYVYMYICLNQLASKRGRQQTRRKIPRRSQRCSTSTCRTDTAMLLLLPVQKLALTPTATIFRSLPGPSHSHFERFSLEGLGLVSGR